MVDTTVYLFYKGVHRIRVSLALGRIAIVRARCILKVGCVSAGSVCGAGPSESGEMKPTIRESLGEIPRVFSRVDDLYILRLGLHGRFVHDTDRKIELRVRWERRCGVQGLPFGVHRVEQRQTSVGIGRSVYPRGVLSVCLPFPRQSCLGLTLDLTVVQRIGPVAAPDVVVFLQG